MHKSFAILALSMILLAPSGANARTFGPSESGAGNLDPLYTLSQRAISLAQSLNRAIGPREQMFDPAYRETIRMQVIPILQDSLLIADEFMTIGGQGPAIGNKIRYDTECMLAAFDHEETMARLKALSDADEGLPSLRARQALIFGEWIRANGRPGGQHKALDWVQSEAEKSPAYDGWAQILMTLLDASPANADVRDRIMRIMSTQLTGPLAKHSVRFLEARQKRAALEGKPLLILGVRYNREMFSSRVWNGKVVMVIFWSSTSPACREAVPNWIRLFEKYNKNGFEIIGVSCDESGDDLLRYKAARRKMAWPELFDIEQPGWHALATEFGVVELPTVMLIDKTGVCRASDAKPDELEELIRKLMAE
jgi:thiol-disulfide isomerase/thioredoxin